MLVLSTARYSKSNKKTAPFSERLDYDITIKI